MISEENPQNHCYLLKEFTAFQINLSVAVAARENQKQKKLQKLCLQNMQILNPPEPSNNRPSDSVHFGHYSTNNNVEGSRRKEKGGGVGIPQGSAREHPDVRYEDIPFFDLFFHKPLRLG